MKNSEKNFQGNRLNFSFFLVTVMGVWLSIVEKENKQDIISINCINIYKNSRLLKETFLRGHMIADLKGIFCEFF